MFDHNFTQMRVDGGTHAGTLSEDPRPTETEVMIFRQNARQVVDWVSDYLAGLENRPVLARGKPGETTAVLPETVPKEPQRFADTLRDFDEIIASRLTHWQAPGWMAYFSSSGSMNTILGGWLETAVSQNLMLWRTSPSATELEDRVCEWQREMLGLPQTFRGVVMDSASVSTLSAIATARESLGWNVREKGLSGRQLPRLRVYTSEHAHSSVDKSVICLGIGLANLVKIRTDNAYRMDPVALDRAISNDRRAGYQPCCVVATVGTTSASSIDPIPDIAAVARRHGIYLHIDAAYGGMAAIAREYRHILAGVECADSVVTNPHKWFTPLQCSIFLTKRADLLKRTFCIVPEYLRTNGGENNLSDFGIHCSKNFRALKFYFAIREMGWNGLAEKIRGHLRMAKAFAGWIDDDDRFELLAPVPLTTVCFRAHPQGWDDDELLNELNERLLKMVNDTGQVFMSHTVLNRKYTLRLALGNIRTQEEHVLTAWKLLQSKLDRLLCHGGNGSNLGSV